MDRPQVIARFHWWLLLIAVIAFVLRLVHVLQTGQVPTVDQPIGDSRGYLDWAFQISQGNWYGSETFYQAPLYPYFLAILKSCFGVAALGIRLAQITLGSVSVLLVGWTSRRLFGDRAGLVAAAMLAAYPPSIFYDALIQKAALASFLLCCFLFFLTELTKRPWITIAMLCGISLALLIVTRENALLWFPIPLAWIVLGLKSPTDRPESGVADIERSQRWKLALGYVAGLTIVLLPVAARNASLGGEWSPTTFQAGPNFYIGNNLGANGVYVPLVPGHETPFYERSDAIRLAEQESGEPLSARQVSRFWMSKAIGEIRQDYLHWFQLMAIKSLMVINHYEVPDVESFAFYREFSVPLLALGKLLHFGILFPLGAIGIAMTIDRWRSLWVYYLLIATMIAAVVAFFILGRYRHPLVPLLLPLAAAATVEIITRLHNRQYRSLVAAALVGAVSAVLANVTIHDENRLEASSRMNVGIAAAKSGNLGQSIQLFRQALEASPEIAEAHFNLARALSLSGNDVEAIRHYQHALQLDERLTEVYYHAATSFERLGHREDAFRFYQRAYELMPANQNALKGMRRTGKDPSPSSNQ
ncbi:ArnT family glycosyltransferase [Stieleria maiorica]|uniref:ArnT family glycosyltransferase n=1 Tax=Stieleria maiorica TaxID=2795974 RepID=UPI001F33AA05|nr:tetratricopeptide repeat protein [Stieleria maiorica]